MSLDQSEKIIKYVTNMNDRGEEYDYDELTIINELDDMTTKPSNQLKEVYEALASERICKECETRKFFDEANSEYYCPVHA